MVIVLAITLRASDMRGFKVRILLEENKFEYKIHIWVIRYG